MEEDSQVRSLLEEVLNSGRTPEEICAAHPELLDEILARWNRIRALSDELDRAFPMHYPDGLNSHTSDSKAPDIPGYVVLEPLGRGGMGVVYRARDLNLDRDVAVKLLLDRYASDSRVARRFSEEARITARLQHPGIPPVHDLGTLPNGRPFLAMKLINGNTLDHLLAARSNPSDGRGRFVATFEQVCHAVAYAHAHHVIHRDLKPSNVMVGAFGEVQVMDWGLAKVLTEKSSPPHDSETPHDADADTGIRVAKDAHQESLPGDLLGTPAFMSPEQAIGAVDRIDARSDVYSLGGILCAILTGKPPHVAHNSEAARQLAAQARLDDARARLSACGAEPELEALCLRCLAPERDNRPQNAGEVAAAVAALRSAAEERAHRAELDRVRLAEHVKRRRALLVAGVVIVVVLIAGLSASLWQTWRAARERDDKQKALIAEQKARELTMAALRDLTDDMVENQMASAVQLTEENKAFLRKIITHFENFADLTADDAASRAIRAEGHARVGMMHYRLGELHDAETAYNTALHLLKQLVDEFPANPELREELASSYYNFGILFRETGRLEKSEASHRAALDLQMRLVIEFPTRPEFRQELAQSYSGVGNLLRSTGRPMEAEAALSEAVNLLKQLVESSSIRAEFREDLATGYNNMGILFSDTGRLKEAEAAYGDALRIQKQLADEFPARSDFRQQLARSQNNFAILLRDTGRINDAKSALDDALATRKQLAADFPTRPEFRQELAAGHNNLGNLLADTGRLSEAEAAWGAAFDLLKQLADDFPTRPEFRMELAKCHGNLGMLYRRTSRPKEAEASYNAALNLMKQLVDDFPARPEFRQFLARNHNSLASLYGESSRLKEAEAAFEDALNIQKQLADEFPNQPDARQDLARSYSNLGVLFGGMGRPDEAESAYSAALAIRKKLVAEFPDLSDMQNDLAQTSVNLAYLCNLRGEFEEAKGYLEEARPHHLAALKASPRHPFYRQYYRNNMMALARANAGLLDQVTAFQAAESIRDLGWDPPVNAFDAARAMAQCIPIVAEHEKLDTNQRDVAVKFYGDAAMKLLHDAKSKGFKGANEIKDETDFETLRQREDYRILVSELEAAGD